MRLRSKAIVIPLVIAASLLGVRVASALTIDSTDPGLTGNLAASWPLNNSGADTSGNGLNLTVNSTTGTTDQNGVANNAYSFNGTSSYLQVPNSPLINTAATYTAKTVTMWFKATNVTTDQYLWEDTQQANSNCFNGEAIEIYNGELYVRATGDPTTSTCTTPSFNVENYAAITANTWYFVSMTMQNGWPIAFYINGVPQASAETGLASSKAGNAGTIYTHAGEPAVIGAAYSTALTAKDQFFTTAGINHYFTGSISQVRVYNRALSPVSISMLYKPPHPQINLASGESGLVGWWKTLGDAKDATPYSDNGTVHGATLTTDRKGAANSAYSFNGSSNVSTALTWPSSGSMSLWADPTSTASWVSPAGWKLVSSSGYILIDEGSSGTWRAVFDATAAGENDVTGPAVALNQWQHLVMTWSKSGSTWTIGLYVNGVSYGTNTQTGTASASIGPFYFGTAGQSATNNFTGKIQDVRVYNRVISQSEVTNLYKSYNSQLELGGSGASGSVSLGSGLVGYWPFNGNSKDATPYQDDGTISGATLASDRKGAANSAYSFNGTSSYIGAPDSPSLEQAGNLTISAWVYPVNNGSYNPIISKGASNEYELAADFRSGAQNLCWESCNRDITNYFSGYTGQWVQVTITVSGTTLNVYRNGALVTSSTGLSARTASSNAVNIGKRPAGSYFWDGSIDDLRLYNRALNAAEVAALYSSYY